MLGASLHAVPTHIHYRYCRYVLPEMREKKKRPDGETARRRGSEIGEIELKDDMTAHLGIKRWMTI